MPDLSRYHARIRPHIDNLPLEVIDDTLRLVLRNICQETRVWTHDEPLYLAEGIDTYTLTPDTGTDIDDVSYVKRADGVRILSRPLPQYESRGSPSLFGFDPARRELVLWPVPDQTGEMTVRQVLMPSLDATSVPDHLYSETAFLAPYGVLAELQAGSDQYRKESVMNRQLYEMEISNRRMRAFLAESKNHYVTPRRFI